MEKNIAVIWGDCSSPEIVKQTIRVLDKVAEKYGHTFHYTDAAMGGEAIDKYGDPLPQHELDKCLAADSVLLGAVGGPKWEGLPGEQRPEKGLLRLRAGMGLYSNNRPAKIWPQLAPASPLKPEIVAQGIDFIIVRELIGGVYFGNHETHTLENGEKQAIDSMPYSEHEIERIGRRARGGPGLAGDVEDALRALLPMLRERSDRTFLRPPAENLRRLVRRHDRRARGDGHEQSETPPRTGLTGAARLLFRRGGFVRPVGVENSVEMVCFVLEDYGRESVDRLRFFGEPLVAVAQYDPLRPHHPAR